MAKMSQISGIFENDILCYLHRMPVSSLGVKRTIRENTVKLPILEVGVFLLLLSSPARKRSEITQMSRDMTKPTKWMCTQRRPRSAWASAQSDQSLRCPHEESLSPYLAIECTAKTLIRLGGCPG